MLFFFIYFILFASFESDQAARQKTKNFRRHQFHPAWNKCSSEKWKEKPREKETKNSSYTINDTHPNEMDTKPKDEQILFLKQKKTEEVT